MKLESSISVCPRAFQNIYYPQHDLDYVLSRVSFIVKPFSSLVNARSRCREFNLVFYLFVDWLVTTIWGATSYNVIMKRERFVDEFMGLGEFENDVKNLAFAVSIIVDERQKVTKLKISIRDKQKFIIFSHSFFGHEKTIFFLHRLLRICKFIFARILLLTFFRDFGHALFLTC